MLYLILRFLNFSLGLFRTLCDEEILLKYLSNIRHGLHCNFSTHSQHSTTYVRNSWHLFDFFIKLCLHTWHPLHMTWYVYLSNTPQTKLELGRYLCRYLEKKKPRPSLCIFEKQYFEFRYDRFCTAMFFK